MHQVRNLDRIVGRQVPDPLPSDTLVDDALYPDWPFSSKNNKERRIRAAVNAPDPAALGTLGSTADQRKGASS